MPQRTSSPVVDAGLPAPRLRKQRRTPSAPALAAMLCAVALAIAVAAPPPAAAQGNSGNAGASARQFGLDAPASIADLPVGALRAKIESLPAPARAHALKWLQDIEFTGADLEFMDVDGEGGVLFVDTLLPEEPAEIGDPEELPLYQQDGGGGLEDTCGGAPVQASGVPSLHSKPGSASVLFLDLDGGTVPSGTAWGGGPYETRPYDRNGDYATVTAAEASDMCEIWLRVAEDFAPFDIDVTTEEPAVFDRYTGRVLITRSIAVNGGAMPYSTAGGVAYVGVFGLSNYHTYYSPAFVYYNNLGGGLPKYVAEAASHEMGHNLALSHDGTASSSYYSGHGSGATSWGPIMGVGYYTNMTQWSRGEYPGANQFQDDVAIIASRVGYEPDDHGDGIATASPLAASAGAIDDWGLIERASDVDAFSFQIPAGTVTIEARNAPDIANASGRPEVGDLDIRLELLDAGGATIAADGANGTPDADITATLPAGTYYLLVSGVGDSATPYSDYGSLGEYYLLGSLPAGAAPNLPPNAAFNFTTDGLTANFSDASSDDDGAVVAWNWDFGDGETATVRNPSHAYAGTGTYQVSLTVTDDRGDSDQTTRSVSVSAPDTNPPSITAPADVGVEATGPLTPVALGLPTVSDDIDPSPAVSASSTGPFPVGITIVIWTATDAAGNSASASQTVTVSDTTPPTVVAPANRTVEATGPLTAVALGTASADDLVDGGLVASPSPSGPFALGVHTVTWSATDSAGNTGSATQTVTVADTTPPAITVLGDDPVVIQPGDSYADAGATADDAVDGDLTASIDTAGADFDTSVEGDHTVTYTVADLTGNVAQATRTVTVAAPLAPEAPAAPSNLSASVTFNGKGRDKTANADLSWTDNAANEDSFVVERCIEEGKGRNSVCVFSEIATLPADTTSFADSPGPGTFHYRVKARNGVGDSDYSNEVKV